MALYRNLSTNNAPERNAPLRSDARRMKVHGNRVTGHYFLYALSCKYDMSYIFWPYRPFATEIIQTLGYTS